MLASSAAFHDLRGTAVTTFAMVGATVPEIATMTSDSLTDVQSILDRNDFHRDPRLSEAGIDQMDKMLAATAAVANDVDIGSKNAPTERLDRQSACGSRERLSESRVNRCCIPDQVWSGKDPVPQAKPQRKQLAGARGARTNAITSRRDRSSPARDPQRERETASYLPRVPDDRRGAGRLRSGGPFAPIPRDVQKALRDRSTRKRISLISSADH